MFVACLSDSLTSFSCVLLSFFFASCFSLSLPLPLRCKSAIYEARWLVFERCLVSRGWDLPCTRCDTTWCSWFSDVIQRFSDVIRCTWVTFIHWCQRNNFTASFCKGLCTQAFFWNPPSRNYPSFVPDERGLSIRFANEPTICVDQPLAGLFFRRKNLFRN